MDTPEIVYVKPDDEPTVFVIMNDLILQIRSKCSDSPVGQDVAS